MSQPYLSMARAKTLLVEIVQSSKPGTKNPRVNGDPRDSCVYWCPLTQTRCIVGEILHRMKMPKPRINYRFGDGIAQSAYVDKGYMSTDACKWLGRVQEEFDARGDNHSFTWRQALRACRQRGLL